jgi:hypothetical protein
MGGFQESVPLSMVLRDVGEGSVVEELLRVPLLLLLCVVVFVAA